MARIRSVHPGLFTDEGFCCVSDSAKILFIGLWTEADDAGLFEWKPLRIKMRLRAATAETADDIEALLHMLTDADLVMRYEVDGRAYGAIRNFMKWQSPKKPTYRFPSLDGVSKYVGGTPGGNEGEFVATPEPTTPSKPDSSVPVPNRFRTSTEIARQREEGEGEGIGRDLTKAAADPVAAREAPADPPRTAAAGFDGQSSGAPPGDTAPPSNADLAEALLEAVEVASGADRSKQAAWAMGLSTAQIWVERCEAGGIGPARAIEMITAKIRERRADKGRGWRPAKPGFWTGMINDEIAAERQRREAEGGYRPGAYGTPDCPATGSDGYAPGRYGDPRKLLAVSGGRP